jgi:hypothetical protein
VTRLLVGGEALPGVPVDGVVGRVVPSTGAPMGAAPLAGVLVDDPRPPPT